jgi:hypothetical protein
LTAWTIGYAVYKEVVMDKAFPGPAVLSLATVLLGIPLAQLIPAPRREVMSGDDVSVPTKRV